MKRSHWWTTVVLVAAGCWTGEVLARGGRGGGGGGFGGGAAARPAARPAFNSSPSMSRPVNPGFGGQMPAAARPMPARPSGAGVGSVGAAGAGGFSGRSPGQAFQGAQGPAAGQRPTSGQLGNFLNMPQQAGPSPFGGGARPPSASQLPSGGQTHTITTPGGGTITVGAGGGSRQTASGATVGGAGAGIKVETAGGQTFVKGSGVAGVSNGAGQGAIAGGSVTGIQGAGGQGAVNIRGGSANSAGYRQGGSITAAQGKHGYTAINARGGFGVGGTGQVGSIGAVRGPGGNVVAAGRGASFVGGQFVGGHAWSAVNGNFTHWNCFTPGWYGRYPGAWWPGKWALATTAWATASWAMASAYSGCSGSPVYYDYGDNVSYQDGLVSYGDQSVATPEQFYDQANDIAQSGQTNGDPSTANDEWLPLGVFAVVAEGQTDTDKVVQLAINKDGIFRGNYEDMLSETLTPIVGAVDKQTQRVALKLATNDSLVMETGLYNLTNDEVPVLIHLGPDRQESRTLVRLNNPETGEKPAVP